MGPITASFPSGVVDITPGETPAEIIIFLHARNWFTAPMYGYWMRAQDGWLFTWEQAVAIEFYLFITLGGK